MTHKHDETKITADGHGTAKDENESGWKNHWDLLMALAILIVLLVLEYGFKIEFPKIPSLAINLVAYLLAGRKVLRPCLQEIKTGRYF